MANTSDGDKGDPPYSPADMTNEHSANNNTISTDIDQDLSYNSNQDDFEFYDNADDIADANMLDPMDVPVARNTDLVTDPAIHTANASTKTSNTANTDDKDNDDDNDDK